MHKRAGFLRRCWRVLRTVRYNRRQQSWINRLGLPSPGIEAILDKNVGDDIVSIHGFNSHEWGNLAWTPFPAVEFNLSCPNVSGVAIEEVRDAIRYAIVTKQRVICKLPPVRWMDWVDQLYPLGVEEYHCCNTIPSPGGGISGKPLMQYSLWAIQEIRRRYPGTTLIGGGGVTCEDDVRAYLGAGADHVAVGSMLFNPLNWRKIPGFVSVAAAREIQGGKR